MSRGMYALLVALPALLICRPVGMTAKKIEIAARKLRLKCARKMERVVANAPAPGGDVE